MKLEDFGFTKNKTKVESYVLENQNGMKVTILSYGATIQSIVIPDKKGVLRDVVLGYDQVEDYEEHTNYFGALVGPDANRIANAQCSIEGVNYQLEKNDGQNNLHSGKNGYSKKVWTLCKEPVNLEPWKKLPETQAGEIHDFSYICDSVTLQLVNEDKEQGFPGKMIATVSYLLDQKNRLYMCYAAKSDCRTVANFTNHSYFNLNGHSSGKMTGQQLQINAEYYTPVHAGGIPTGVLEKVVGTPMDFTWTKEIGKEIEADYEQLHLTGGYDHNFVLRKEQGSSKEQGEKQGPQKLISAAKAWCPESGIGLEVLTDCPGVQFYSGNGVPIHTGKKGASYGDRNGFCLEPQYFPNAINQEGFEAPLTDSNNEYYSWSAFCFQQE